MRAQLAATGDRPVPTLLSSILHVFRTAFPQASRLARANEALSAEIVRSVVSQLEKLLAQDGTDASAALRADSLVAILDVFEREVFDDDDDALVTVRLRAMSQLRGRGAHE